MLTLPQLGYAYNALEPFIDAQTMEIHYTKHHQAYLDKTNGVLEKYPALAAKPIEELIRDIETLEMDDADRKALRNNGGGFVNHTFFWEIMGANKEIDNALVDAISKEFGSVDEFKKLFTQAATTQFGSGWAWLAKDASGKLSIYSTPNQDSPLSKGHTPLIGLDVWEHAYYLKYQNRRPEYVENWWNVLKLV